MIVEDQGEVIAFLSRPATYGDDVAAVERVETHISVVFLAGDRAYKLKRAARFPYLDFSTREKRAEACRAEVAINRRTAPSLYRGVVAVRRAADGTLRLGGEGEPADWLVEMARFDQVNLFDRLAQRGGLDRRIMEETAEAVARFHAEAEPRPEYGGSAGTAAIIASNAACLAESPAGTFEPTAIERLNEAARRALADLAPLLDGRRRMGRVRHCHGDLHLRNLCLVDGRPTLFDAIEFSAEIAHIDVLYDLAFLLMDLEHRALRALANVVFNRYLDVAATAGLGEGEGLRTLPLFHSMRAAVRAHVGAAAAALADGEAAGARRDEARGYLDMALAYLEPPPPVLIAIGGLSGTGKSATARAIAPLAGAAPGARVLRSDVVRKRLAGVPIGERLDAAGYSREMTERTYRTLFDETRAVLAAGHAVVADAVFAGAGQRAAIAEIAAGLGVPFHGLWLEAPAAVLLGRVGSRGGDASDATPEVVRQQLTYDLGVVGWPRLDSSGSAEDTASRAGALVGLRAAAQRR